MEKTDRKILSLLATDGRMSFTDLGKATGLSTSAVHQRVKRLEQRGIEVLRIPYNEIQKNGGGIHCSTMELIRDDIG